MQSNIQYVIIRPGDLHIDSAPSYSSSAPAPKGISIKGERIYLNGERYFPKTGCCFLLFDAKANSFVELPVDQELKSHDDISRLVIWGDQVMPAMDAIAGHEALP